ncbi:MAG: HAD-IA family hydrolase [Burkholderiales bacterium]|nr:HAD-IA family hydrolase [Burkholderiales bacterium]
MSAELALEFRRQVMTSRLDLCEIEAIRKTGASVADIVQARNLVAAEVASVRLRPGIRRMLGELPVPYAVCSNLSVDYVTALRRFPEIRPVFEVLSCDVGHLKPDAEIYDIVISRAGLRPDQILFVGDTEDADIAGPRRAGMVAMHVDDFLARASA